MKEQYNQFQKKIEKTSQLKPEAHFIINDAAKNILNNMALSKIESDAIEAISIELQELDRAICMFLLDIKNKGLISHEECSLVVSYFLASKQIGPNSEKIRDSFYETVMSIEDFQELLKSVSIPEYSRLVVLSVYRKIFESNNKKV